MSGIAEQLSRQIDVVLDKLMEGKQPLEADSIINTVVGTYDFKVSKRDAAKKAFMEWCTRDKVRAAVRSRINRRAGGEAGNDNEQQYLLPGFKYLHRYYFVRREIDGEVKDVALPIDEMTSLERQARAQLFRHQGKTLFAHAQELDRYDEELSGKLAAS